MSDVASRDSIGGSGGGSATASPSTEAVGACGDAGSRCRAAADRLRRDQRVRKPSSALMGFPATILARRRAAPRENIGIGAVALALRKGRRGRVLRDKG